MEKLELMEEYEALTEIPDYGFSGRDDLVEIRIPAGVRKIGRYAFYNCRNLRKIIFYSHIRDVGSGAFTGCHKVSHLDVTIVEGQPSCLKDFLQELTEEMVVDYRGGTYARLLFPEYYEEGVENTPARILMTEIHGSGLKYRNCFLKTEFQFAEYDKQFPYAKAWETPRFVQDLVLGRLMYPLWMSERARKEYESYLQDHLFETGERLIREGDVERLSWLLTSAQYERERLEQWLDVAAACQLPECTGLLMEQKRKRFPAQGRRQIPDFDF